MTARTASCACGTVGITAGTQPAIVSMCHRPRCKKRTGSTSSPHASFARDAVAVTGTRSASTREGNAGCEITVRFCPICTSTTDWDVEAMPDRIGVPVGLFADPDFAVPSVSTLSPQKHPRVSVPAGAPKRPGHSDSRLMVSPHG